MTRRCAAGAAVVVLAMGLSTLVPPVKTAAAPVSPPAGKSADRSLGNGLGRLLEQAGSSQQRQAGGFRMDQDRLTIRDSAGRVLVDLTPQAGVDRRVFRRQAEALGLQVQAVDSARGTLEGFVPLSAVRPLSALPGTGTLAQAVKPQAHVGDATSQGVALQRVDRAQRKGATGRGITIGALSDSYDTATTTLGGDPLTIHAANDVASGDLPGRSNARYPQPVVVLQESQGSDEGRAMLQIAHDVAPAAKLCFATAFAGQVSFANNIRALADKSGRCRADVVVDDVGYLDEPFFSDGIISDAVDDVAAQGVHYFSSAGNAGIQQAWASRARLLPRATATRGTNLDFSEVDPALYSGGLQDMDPGSGTDVAQDLRIGEEGGFVNLQWDDPLDVDGSTYGSPLFSATGDITTADPEPALSFTPTAAQVGQLVEFRTDGIPSGSTDLILTVTAPDGSVLGPIDTGPSPEVVATTLRTGTYTISVSGFEGDTGDFTVLVRPVTSLSKVSTDYNLLFFAPDGSYLGASADLNLLSGRPAEIAPISGLPDVQLVIARAGTGRLQATRLRTEMVGDVYLNEYSDPLAPAVNGHPAARGATAVAAYDPFRPYLPEAYTSPGGNLPIIFNSDGERYRTLQRRRVPQIASADGGNTTFFGEFTPEDGDSQPNFFGTSASAPHAASIAALALQKAGGPKSLSPTALRRRLERSTFAHDLDPYRSVGRAGGVTVVARGAETFENRPVSGSLSDPRFFTLRYRGRVPLRSITFYGETASPTALGATPASRSAGIVFDPRPYDGSAPFGEDGFPFTVGSTSGGLRASSVRATFARPGGTEPGQYQHLTVSFRTGIRRGQALQFGVDRDLVVSGFGSSIFGNSADELGGATFLPSGKKVPRGMVFVATRADGKRIRGAMVNPLGTSYTKLDGYGVVNAERAIVNS